MPETRSPETILQNLILLCNYSIFKQRNPRRGVINFQNSGSFLCVLVVDAAHQQLQGRWFTNILP
jgi:hypothetical protein